MHVLRCQRLSRRVMFNFKNRNLGAEMFWVPQFAPWFCVLKISRRKFVLFIWPFKSVAARLSCSHCKFCSQGHVAQSVDWTRRTYYFFVYLGFYLIIRYTVTKEMLCFEALFDWSKRQNTDYSVENDVKAQIYIYFDVTNCYLSVLAKACCSCHPCRHSWVQTLRSTNCEPICDYISF